MIVYYHYSINNREIRFNKMPINDNRTYYYYLNFIFSLSVIKGPVRKQSALDLRCLAKKKDA